MAILEESERDVAHAVAGLLDCNPFEPQRVELERRALGDAFVGDGPGWRSGNDDSYINPNTARLRQRIEELVANVARRTAAGASIAPEEVDAYRGTALYLLWLRYEDPLYELVVHDESAAEPPAPVEFYPAFANDVVDLLAPLPGPALDPAILFAHGFQARRAFHLIFRRLFGSSMAAMRLRAAAWYAIFSGAPLLDRMHLVDRIRNIPTLITGESGTGKDLVARAIGLSQFIPFDAATRRFACRASQRFVAVNLTAFSPTVIESELFGHVRGAFTGADQQRTGWLETAGAEGAVFFDEIGDLDPTVQVKLLRVLQNRVFHRVGDSRPVALASKIVAATNRDLEDEVAHGRFRQDFYRRICTSRIRTPSLREQLADDPDELAALLLVAAQRVVGTQHAAEYAERAMDFVRTRLGTSYPWPGNMRELEECVTSVFVRHEFVPSRLNTPAEALAAAIERGDLTAKELLRRYAAIIARATSSQREAAQRLGLDRRALSRLLKEPE